MKVGTFVETRSIGKGEALYSPYSYRVVRFEEKEEMDRDGNLIVVERVELSRIVVPGTGS